MADIEEVINKAIEIAALIEPLGDLEQRIVLENSRNYSGVSADFSLADPCRID